MSPGLRGVEEGVWQALCRLSLALTFILTNLHLLCVVVQLRECSPLNIHGHSLLKYFVGWVVVVFFLRVCARQLKHSWQQCSRSSSSTSSLVSMTAELTVFYCRVPGLTGSTAQFGNPEWQHSGQTLSTFWWHTHTVHIRQQSQLKRAPDPDTQHSGEKCSICKAADKDQTSNDFILTILLIEQLAMWSTIHNNTRFYRRNITKV